jgi:hypothetical protein
MTNIQAADLLKGLEQCLDDYCELNDEGKAAFRMAITALELFGISEQLPSAQPEPCEDAVSRKAVEEMLKNGFPASGMWEIEGDVVKQTVCETLADALMDLGKLPSVTPKQRWIPCSKKLPDIKEHHCSEPCIVYCENGAYGFAELEENIFGQVGWNCERDDEYHEPLGKVLAWMPLPEPYQGDGNDETD